MTKKINIPVDKNIVQIPLEEAMPDNYLPYAVDVAKERAIPDVRDGLKPVHRRIIYGAYMLKAFPDRPYYKSARIVGDILGKYHPHGDSSVYDSMVILAQNFTTRMPLIDGHGNWGSQDGDCAAAMRYTEARLTNISMEMIRDIDKDVVDMVDNYSGSEKEPEVLPSRYPNILVNGSFGIAVGLATNIPPHNLNEVIDACVAIIDKPDIDTCGLMNYVKGPDLPTGGILIGKNSLLSAYESGEGKVTLRAKTNIQRLDNGRLGIVITEFPYRRSKAKLLQTISDMTADKKHSKVLEVISDIRDESDRTGIRAVIEFKKSVDMGTADKVLKYLFKKTDLQCNISFNMVALADGKPQTMGLKTILRHYVDYQKDVVMRRTTTELNIAKKRFHIVEGFIKAIGIMDEVIITIRSSKSKKDAQKNLIDKFGFTGIQSESILELMLYRLTGLEIKTFEKEYNELCRKINKLQKILSSDRELFKLIKKELLEIKNKYGDSRRTSIIENDSEAKIEVEDIIVDEDIVVTLSNDGFIKRVSLRSYNRSNPSVSDIEYREGDFSKFLIKSNTKHSLIFFTNKGNLYKVRGVNVPEFKWKDKGEKIDNIIKGIDLDQERIIAVYSINDFHDQFQFVFFTNKGGIKKTSLERFDTTYTKIMALKLKNNEELLNVHIFEESKRYIYIKTKNGLNFTIEIPDICEMDRNIMPFQMFNLSNNDEVNFMKFVNECENKSFEIIIDRNGILKSRRDKKLTKNSIKLCTDSSSRILIFTKDGEVYSINARMLQNIEDGIDIKNIFNGLKKDNILNIFSINKFSDEEYIYFFTKYGMIKKTSLCEFNGNYDLSTAYKFKRDDDKLIGVYISNGNNEKVILITQKMMCIEFETNNVNPMGKIASGVTGINLNEDDEVIFVSLLSERDLNRKLLLKLKKSQKITVNISDIRVQNRAGKGKKLFLIDTKDQIISINIV
ncbi:DNA topoisomerase IV subunit A [Clostridium fermenticellae]|uniref:DNA topoisomerase (ATP-hydrolyzing) n=1 Tax=Clostridium fermenticellae TaxID=2068654 RepID=A0A386H555_9CLOT|nr:DNA topoisomerase IV subunit A [Clostridium fermenticellae]AYD40744.1 DNA topoisomerase IV subunit A [Clostridium fermenticellae]